MIYQYAVAESIDYSANMYQPLYAESSINTSTSWYATIAQSNRLSYKGIADLITLMQVNDFTYTVAILQHIAHLIPK